MILDNKDIQDLKKYFSNKYNKKIFLITGYNSFLKSKANKLFKNIINNNSVNFYFKKSSNPDLIELKLIIKELIKFKPNIILAIGGGSVIDYAKLSNVLYNEKNLSLKILKKKYKIKKKFATLIAIPTTAGSGAEETSFSTIYVNKVKYSVETNLMKPDQVFIIPQLIFNCTKKIKASSGFDAISQAIESLVSRNSNVKSVKYSIKSLEYTLKNYLNYIKDPSIKNSYYMLLGANYAGKAINISKTNGPHALSYPFTANFGISHGHAVSLTLNDFLKFNFANQDKSNCDFSLKKRFQMIFEVTNTKSIKSLDDYLINLKKNASLEQNYLKLGVNINKDYSKIMSQINLDRLSNNPINLDKDIIRKILFKKI